MTAGPFTYVNWSALLVALLPAGVVTVTSTGLPVTEPIGAVAVIELSESTVTSFAAVDPKSTAFARERPVPVTVTTVPFVPTEGDTAVTVGSPADPGRYEYMSAVVCFEVPSLVVTVTFTAPDPLGEVATSSESEWTLKDFTRAPPKCTAVVPLKPKPLMATVVPPSWVPDVGSMPVTTGADGAT